MDKSEIAKNHFNNGYNCAQSVLKPFATQLNFDLVSVLKLSSGFGAGMGRTQSVCGALTGAYMVLGLKYGEDFPDDQSREKVISKIQELTKRFKEEHGFTNCKDLLKVDLKTEEGQRSFSNQDLHEKVCSLCVNSSINLLEELMSEADF